MFKNQILIFRVDTDTTGSPRPRPNQNKTSFTINKRHFKSSPKIAHILKWNHYFTFFVSLSPV